MPRYIDADKAIENIRSGGGTSMQKLFAECCVLAIPAADVMEVVRCKDCSYSEDRQGACLYCKINRCLFNRDGFCSYGKRRDTNVPTKKTNFDRIKAMTVDELAVLLCKGSICVADKEWCCKLGKGKCENCLKEWLESEVECDG